MRRTADEYTVEPEDVVASMFVKNTCPNCGLRLHRASLAQHLAERCALRRGGSARRRDPGAREVPVLAQVAEETRTVRPCRWCGRPTLLATIDVHERICALRSLASPVVATRPHPTETPHAEPAPPPPAERRPGRSPLQTGDPAAPKSRYTATTSTKPWRRPPPIIEVRRGTARTVGCPRCGRAIPVIHFAEHQVRGCSKPLAG